ncbi:MAG: hypothetical protein ACFE0S_17520 [Rhodospirillales bacterium]
MPIESTCTCHDDIFEIKIDGAPEAEEVVAIVTECYAKFSFKHAIWDFRRSSLSGFGARAFKEVAAAGARFADKRGPGAKTAMIVSDSSEVILVKAYAASASEVLPIHIRAFMNEQEARHWLTE